MKKFLLIILIGIFHQNINSQSKLSEKYNLMPWPQEIKENNSKFQITKNLTITILGNDTETRVEKATISFLRRLTNRTGIFIEEGFPVKSTNASIRIYFDRTSKLTVNEDESYKLSILEDKILINAKTDVGALRGLETLLQLVKSNEKSFYFSGVVVKDFPRFVWRGLMIDAARHFQPVNVLKRNLRAMASVKMNVFHWHLTDDQGFRVESKVFPKLQKNASDGLFYTQEQIKDVVKYASDLGIRVVPEFDVPGHASAILAAYPELGSKDNYKYKVERFAGVFDPTLNPTKEVTYLFLETLFREITPLFPDEYFHIGGDENEGKHWDESAEIQKFKKEHNLKNNHNLQTYFNVKLEKILKKLDKKLMGWDEILTSSLPTSAVVHSWRGKHEGLQQSTLIEAAKKGYQSVLSAGYYIDRMLSVEHHYTVDPIGEAKLTKEERKKILGAEATMWSELVTPLTIDSRIWPRTAAIAERFWSKKEINNVSNMYKRLKVVNFQLEELGITHIRNKDVILRNLTNNQNTQSLETLSNISEPLKVYSRNKGGTEYKSFSPFTLFADACNVDASDAKQFNLLVKDYKRNKNKESFKRIKKYFFKWINGYEKFKKLKSNSKLKEIAPLYHNLANTSSLFLKFLNNKSKNIDELKKTIKILKEPVVDVEIAIINSLESLLN